MKKVLIRFGPEYIIYKGGEDFRAKTSFYSEHTEDENQKSVSKGEASMKRIALVVLIFGLLALWRTLEAGELAILYSNDTSGVIDPCPT